MLIAQDKEGSRKALHLDEICEEVFIRKYWFFAVVDCE